LARGNGGRPVARLVDEKQGKPCLNPRGGTRLACHGTVYKRNGEALSLFDRAATEGQRAIVAVACGAFLVAAALVLPFAAVPLRPLPNASAIFATGILVADICTYLLLHAQFRVSGERWLLPLACGYLFSAQMSLLHLLTFPGALVADGPVLGSLKTVAWLYLAWGLGFIALLLAALVAAGRSVPARDRTGAVSAAATTLVVAALLAFVLLEDRNLPALAIGDRFSPWSIAFNYLRGLLAIAGLVMIWATDRRQRLLLLWLSVVLLATSVSPVLTDLGGQRYTLGWYAGRACFLFASYVVLAVLLKEFVQMQQAVAAAFVRAAHQADALKQEVDRRTLAERRVVASERNQAIGQLVRGVAHDFNNLLTAITANLEIILRVSKETGVQRSAENAQHAAFRGARLTQSLLAFSGRQTLRSESVAASDLLVGSQVLLQRAAGEQVRVEIRPSISTWKCHADPAQLEIALLNLIANARDAMPTGGRITISTRNVLFSDRHVDESYAELPAGDYVEICVSDTGSGIPLELRERVFEPFFTTKEPSRGAGLGLSQVQGFARQSGGDVAIESSEAAGTRVRLLLPRSVQERTLGEFVHTH
jgi:signal transduction histidine kinase